MPSKIIGKFIVDDDLAGFQQHLQTDRTDLELYGYDGEHWYKTIMHKAAKYGRNKFIAVIASENPQLISHADDNGLTPASTAAKYNHLSSMFLLLTLGCHLKPKDYETTPLHMAAQYGHDEIVEAVFNLDNSLIDFYDDYGCPMDLAASNNHCTTIQLLIRLGSKSHTNGNPWKPLHYAAKHGSYEATQLFLDIGVPIDVLCGNKTPMHYALERGCAGMVSFLDDRGSTTIIDADESLMCMAVGSPVCVTELVRLGYRTQSKEIFKICGSWTNYSPALTLAVFTLFPDYLNYYSDDAKENMGYTNVVRLLKDEDECATIRFAAHFAESLVGRLLRCLRQTSQERLRFAEQRQIQEFTADAS